MKVSVIAPVFNEIEFIGYSLMAIKDHIHEVIYACADSTDGTDELLFHVKQNHMREKLQILKKPEYNFDPMDMAAYNRAFNDCIQKSTGHAVWFLHPDMILKNPESLGNLKPGPQAWFTNIASYAGDFQTRISRGRTDKWKNIHVKTFGIHYYGGYGSDNEDFYHSDITGKSYRFHGTQFEKYPYEVADSGIQVNHYCELKAYKRRLEKMKLCLRTQYPHLTNDRIAELAVNHPRVTLEVSSRNFGTFEFEKDDSPIPEVFLKYRDEFESFKKTPVAA